MRMISLAIGMVHQVREQSNPGSVMYVDPVSFLGHFVPLVATLSVSVAPKTEVKIL
jgi:hypothetical protein